MELGGAGPDAIRAPTLRHAHVVILEVSWATLEAATSYRAGHIPGAFHLNTDSFEDGYPTWKLRPVEELQAVIGGLGISRTSTVVVYGEQVIAAARAWWVLMYAGVTDVRLLDGGYAAWSAAGFEGEAGANEPLAVPFAASARPGMLASTTYVRDALASGHAVLADVRSRAEFDGEVSGYDYLKRKGRIPGALHAGDADDTSHLYSHADGTLHDPADIAETWSAAGIRFDGEVIFTCGSGWRSSLAFFHAWLLGCDAIRNYSDGWCGWSTTYIRDPAASGSTPGWRQEPTTHAIHVDHQAHTGDDWSAGRPNWR